MSNNIRDADAQAPEGQSISIEEMQKWLNQHHSPTIHTHRVSGPVFDALEVDDAVQEQSDDDSNNELDYPDGDWFIVDANVITATTPTATTTATDTTASNMAQHTPHRDTSDPVKVLLAFVDIPEIVFTRPDTSGVPDQ